MLADAAERLVGCKFRLHGRDPTTGLDCVGVLAAALATLGRPASLPMTYTLRTITPPDVSALARRCGMIDAPAPTRPGDVMLARLGPCQHHLLIALGPARFVHAHASLRRVVTWDAELEWPLVGSWRLSAEL